MIFELVATVASAGAPHPAPNDLAISYKKCVEAFAISQIRSGDSSEILVRAGKAECVDEYWELRKLVFEAVIDSSEIQNALEVLPEDQVTKIANESADKRFNEFVKISESAALRNVVFVRARIAEIESDK